MRALRTPLTGTVETVILAQVATAALVGLLLAPALLGPDGPGSAYTAAGLEPRLVVWLVVASLIAIWLLILAPGMVQITAKLLARALPNDPTLLDASSSSLPALARWLVALGYVVLSSAILRTPLVSVLSSFLDPLAVASAVAGVVVLLLILVLVRLHQAAAPAVETYAWHALDALVSTSGSLPAGRSQRAIRTRTPSTARAEVQRGATPSAEAVPSSPTIPPDDRATEGSVGANGHTLPEATGTAGAARASTVAESPARTVAGPARVMSGQASSGEEQTQLEVAVAPGAVTAASGAETIPEGTPTVGGQATEQESLPATAPLVKDPSTQTPADTEADEPLPKSAVA